MTPKPDNAPEPAALPVEPLIAELRLDADFSCLRAPDYVPDGTAGWCERYNPDAMCSACRTNSLLRRAADALTAASGNAEYWRRETFMRDVAAREREARLTATEDREALLKRDVEVLQAENAKFKADHAWFDKNGYVTLHIIAEESKARADAAEQVLREVRAIGRALYVAGRWDCAILSAAEAADLWTRFRDALALPAGTATALGVEGVSAPPGQET